MRVIPFVVFVLLAAPATAGPTGLEAAREYRQRQGPAILEQFAELLRIPNTPGQPGLVATARYLVRGFADRGIALRLVQLEQPEVPPAVVGKLAVEGATRTLGIYVHYDGQPVDESQWTHPPFEPTLYTGAVELGGKPRRFPRSGEPIDPEWRIYARSAGDDKAPFQAMLSALDALRVAGLEPTSNLVFVFEGEEEIGSDHLVDYLVRASELAEVDLWLICDGPVHPSRRPQLVFGVRGYTGLDLTVYGATRYLHSGHYGNWAPNPAMMLAQLLASMKDAEGRVVVAGFHDTVLPLGPEERAALDHVPAIDVSLREELALARSEADGAPLAERLLLPSLNVRGLASATVGPTARNVIPTRAEASLDIRLVKGNDPEAMLDLVERHIREQGYHIVRDEPDGATRRAHGRIARVVRRPGYRAVRTSMELPAVRDLVAAATRVTGEAPILLPSLGGSLPLYLFEDRFDRPLVVVPIANHDDNQHAPDENLRLANLWYGIDLMAELFAPSPRSDAR